MLQFYFVWDVLFNLLLQFAHLLFNFYRLSANALLHLLELFFKVFCLDNHFLELLEDVLDLVDTSHSPASALRVLGQQVLLQCQLLDLRLNQSYYHLFYLSLEAHKICIIHRSSHLLNKLVRHDSLHLVVFHSRDLSHVKRQLDYLGFL